MRGPLRLRVNQFRVLSFESTAHTSALVTDGLREQTPPPSVGVAGDLQLCLRSFKTSSKPESTLVSAVPIGTRRWLRTSTRSATRFTSSISARPSRVSCLRSASLRSPLRAVRIFASLVRSVKHAVLLSITQRKLDSPTLSSDGSVARSRTSARFASVSSVSKNSIVWWNPARCAATPRRWKRNFSASARSSPETSVVCAT